MPWSPLSQPLADAGSITSHGSPINAFQTDNKEVVKMATSLNLSHLYKHTARIQKNTKNMPALVGTGPLLALSAGQDTNCCKHKLFDLVSGLKKD